MKLRNYLAGQGLTAADFGRRVGVSMHTVGKWVRGETIPRRDAMQSIVRVTAGAVGPDDFFPGGSINAPRPAVESTA